MPTTLDDYSLDPFQAQEQDLNEQYKRALAKTVRKPDPSNAYNLVGHFQNAYDVSSGNQEIKAVQGKRDALAQQFQSSLADALRDAPPEIAAAIQNPGLRQQGLAEYARVLKQKGTQRAMDALDASMTPPPNVSGNATIGGGGMAPPPPAQGGGNAAYIRARKMAESDDPELQRIGKVQLEQMKPFDPGHTVMRDPNGNIITMPGALQGATSAETAKRLGQDPMVDSYDANGTKVSVPRSVAWPEQGQSLPNATRAATPPNYSPGSVGAAPNPMPASGPNMPVNGPPTGGGGNAPNVPPLADLQAAFAQAQQRLAANPNDQQAQSLMNYVAPLIQRMQSQPPQGQQQPQPVALPGAVSAADAGPNRNPNPVPTPGGPVSPVDIKRTELQTKAIQEDLQKFNESGGAVMAMKNQLRMLSQLNDKPVYGGYSAPFMEAGNAIANTFGSSPDQKLANTRTMDALIKEMAGPRARQLGYNPSNFDLNTALAQLPTIKDNPQTRAAIIAQLQKGLEYHEQSIPVVNELVQKYGMSVAEAQKKFDAIYQAQQNAQNPNPAPGNQSALPGARSATAVRQPKTGAGSGDAGDQPQGFWSGVLDSAKALPGAVASSSGVQAMYDQWVKNPTTAAGQLVGLSDREDWKREKAIQEERKLTDPKYNQASTLYGIANPTSLIGGGAGGIVKNMVAGAAQGVLQPNDTATGQIGGAVLGGTLNAATGLLSKAVPTTAPHGSLGPDAEALLAKYPNVRPTSAQLSPDSVSASVARGLGGDTARAAEQQIGLTKDLMKQAGLPGDRLSSKVLNDAREAMGTEYNTLLPKGNAATIGQSDKDALNKAIKASFGTEPAFATSPALATVFAAIQSGNPVKVTADVLHQAWKDVGSAGADKYASGQIREVLEGLIAKTLQGGKIDSFKELNKRWGAVEDITRVFSEGGGGGKGSLRGTISPAKLESEAGMGPNPGGITDQAMDLVNLLNMKNAKTSSVSPTSKLQGLLELAGPTINKLDRSLIHAPKWQKKIAEGLRAGVSRTTYPLIDEVSNAP